MVLFVGEAVTITAAAQDPLRSDANITTATAVVDFYAPGKDPKNVAADRVPDKPQVAMSYDAAATVKVGSAIVLGAYVGFVNTAAWTSGKWSFKVTLSGAYSSWEYGSFTLKA